MLRPLTLDELLTTFPRDPLRHYTDAKQRRATDRMMDDAERHPDPESPDLDDEGDAMGVGERPDRFETL